VDGPADRLNSTVVSQPALFVAGLAAVEQLRQQSPQEVESCAAAAGLSLGEYTALVFAGAMSFEDGLEVVKVRGEAMQSAADAGPGGMVSVLGLELEQVESACKEASAVGLIRIANLLCPGNIVVSGVESACGEFERIAAAYGAIKTIRLAVAGAFHTSMMDPARDRLEAALQKATVYPPRIPVISNVDAKPHFEPDEIRSILVRQLVEPVLWEQSMRRLMVDGFDRFYEFGPGRVLAGLMKRIHRKCEFVNVMA
jgi:[acyl-carrier-protein] S-malonyltransferase